MSGVRADRAQERAIPQHAQIEVPALANGLRDPTAARDRDRQRRNGDEAEHERRAAPAERRQKQSGGGERE